MFEKRVHPRREIEIDVVIHAPGGERIAAKTRDISIGGMFLNVSRALPFGAEVKIELPLPGVGQTELPAFVRWTKPDGMGVQFGLLGARQTHAISTLVEGRDK